MGDVKNNIYGVSLSSNGGMKHPAMTVSILVMTEQPGSYWDYFL